MTDKECMQKLSAISNYCCAQKDKDALDYAMTVIKTSVPREQIGMMIGEIEQHLTNIQYTIGVMPETEAMRTKLKGAEDALIDALYTIHYYTDIKGAEQ